MDSPNRSRSNSEDSEYAASFETLPIPSSNESSSITAPMKIFKGGGLISLSDSDRIYGSSPLSHRKVPWAPAERIKTFSYHGTDIFDDYNWLKEKENPRVLKYLEDENRYTDACMKTTKDLQNTLYDEFVSRVVGDERSSFKHIDDYFYYTRTEAEAQYPAHCRRFETLDNEEQVILDENRESEGEDFFTLGGFEVSMDHNYLVYGVDTEGKEIFTLRFKNLITGEWFDDEIYGAGMTVRWAADNSTVFYTKVNEAGRSYRLYRHTLRENATDGSDDELIFQEDDPLFVLRIGTTNNRKYFVLHIEGQITREIVYLSTNNPRGEFKPILERKHNVLYTVGSHGPYWYIRTNEGAPNYKVIKAPIDTISDRESWEEVVPHRDDIYIERFDMYRHHCVCWEWENGLQKIRVQDLSDGEVHYVQMTEPLYGVWAGELPDQDEVLDVPYFNTNLLQFTYTSFLQPYILFEYDMDNRRKRKMKETVVPGFVKDQYHQKRIFATSWDEKIIPISLVYKISLRDTATGNPLLLAGYGAYGSMKYPAFSAERLSLLDRGIIFAWAHVRGDATMGAQWYEEGKFLLKKNTFLDFISCAEHLVSEGFTSADKLAIWGRSAGGLLVTAVTNMRPDLFKVVTADVPFVDVGTLFDPKVPWTTFEWEEWGNPNNKDVFDYMLSYSPYANIEAKDYPNMFITAGLNDSRVAYWEPAKYTAKLRKMKTDSNLLLLKTYLAGHMGTSGRFDHYEETGLQYAFIIQQLGIASQESSKPLMAVLSPVAVAPPDLLAMFQGYQVTMILCAALELGVFDELHRQPAFTADCATLAEALKVSHRGLARLLDALISVGLLDKDGEKVLLTPIASSHLVQGMPGYIGDLRLGLSSSFQWHAVRKLPEIVRNGYATEESPRELPINFAQSTVALNRHAGTVLNAALAPWVKRRKILNVLDLYCSNGYLGFSVAKRYTNVKVCSMDIAEVLDIARRIADEMAITEKVEFITSTQRHDLRSEVPEGPFDLIIIGANTLNSFGFDEATNAIQHISNALKSTGRLVLFETVSGLDASPYPHLQSISMFTTRKKGKVHDLSWYRELLTGSGFSEPLVHDLRPFPEKLLISFRNIISKHSRP